MIKKLINQLKNGKETKRIDAANVLAEVKSPSELIVPALILALDDPCEYVTIRAAFALEKTRDTAADAIPALFQKVVEGAGCHYAAADSIASIGRLGIEFLHNELRDKDLARSIAALYALYEFGRSQDSSLYPELVIEILLMTIEIYDNDNATELLRDSATLTAAALVSNKKLHEHIDLEILNERLLKMVSSPNCDLASKASHAFSYVGRYSLNIIVPLIQAIKGDVWWAPLAAESFINIEEAMLSNGNNIYSNEVMNKIRDLPLDDFKLKLNELSNQSSDMFMEERIKKQGLHNQSMPSVEDIEVLGLHKIRAGEPCHLIEIKIDNSTGKFLISDFGQYIPEINSYQVAYDERFLNSTGDLEISAKGLDWPDSTLDLKWVGEVRITFFLHYLNVYERIETPFGFIELPKTTPKPVRLKFIKYGSP